MDGEVNTLLRKGGNAKIKLDFMSSEQIDVEMKELLKHYGADKSQADLDKTRAILKRFGNINDELAAMREENR